MKKKDPNSKRISGEVVGAQDKVRGGGTAFPEPGRFLTSALDFVWLESRRAPQDLLAGLTRELATVLLQGKGDCVEVDLDGTCLRRGRKSEQSTLVYRHRERGDEEPGATFSFFSESECPEEQLVWLSEVVPRLFAHIAAWSRRCFDPSNPGWDTYSLAGEMVGLSRSKVQSGEILHVNKTLSRMLGYDSPGELVGTNAVDLYQDPADAKTLRDELARKGRVDGVELKYRCGKSQNRWLRGSAWLNEGGDEIFAVSVDITSQKETEAALERSVSLYRSVYETAPLAFVLWDPSRSVLDWNRKAEELFGWTREEALGRDFFDFMVHPQMRDQVKEVVATLMEGQTTSGVLHPVMKKDGCPRWCEWYNAPLKDAHEDVIGVLSLAADRSKRMEFEEKLRASEARYRGLLENASDSIYTLNLQGVITSQNRAGEPLTGYRVDELIGMQVEKLVAPEDLALAREMMRRKREEHKSTKYQFNMMTKDGERKRVEVHSQVVMREGEVVEIEGIARDVTERYELEQLRERLLADVSHEIKAPLSILEMGLEQLHRTLDRPHLDRKKASDTHRIMLSEIRRLRSTVDGILDLSRLEEGPERPAELEEFDLRDLVQETIRQFEGLFESKKLEVRCSLKKAPIEADREALSMVIRNLIDNAIKFTQSGTIVVTLGREAQGSRTVFSVEDTGRGISSDDIGLVFERYYQVDKNISGSGAGLAICKEVVERHGGEISVRSRGRGLGSHFEIDLPTRVSD